MENNTSNFYSRSRRRDIEDLMESFKPGHYFVERKSDNKWLVPFCTPEYPKEEDWTNDPNKAMSWRTKPLAELEIIRMKLGDSCLVTEHEFIDPPNKTKPDEYFKIHEPETSFGDLKEIPNCLLKEIYDAMYYYKSHLHPNQKYRGEEFDKAKAATRVVIKLLNEMGHKL